MQATLLRYLCYLALVVGVAASFWMLRAGALCFLFAIACAHLAGTARAELHAKWTQETLFIVLNLLAQMNKKIGDEGDSSGDQAPQEPTRAVKLREVRDA